MSAGPGEHRPLSAISRAAGAPPQFLDCFIEMIRGVVHAGQQCGQHTPLHHCNQLMNLSSQSLSTPQRLCCLQTTLLSGVWKLRSVSGD